MDLEERKTLAEIEKLEVEKRLLSKELSASQTLSEKLPGLGSLILAIVAVCTLLLNLGIEGIKYFDNERKLRAIAIEDLMDPLSSKRMAASVYLSPFVANNAGDNEYLKSIALAVASENSPVVREAFLITLAQSPEAAVYQLRTIQNAANTAAVRKIGRWGGAVRRLQDLVASQAKVEVIVAGRKQVVDDLQVMREMQWQVVRAADAIRILTCEEETICGIDLSGAFLRSFTFSDQNIDLRGANFSGAGLLFTDFFSESLDGANFRFAEAQFASFAETSLKGTDFSSADIGFYKNITIMSEREAAACVYNNGTTFENADVTDAVFAGATATHTNFGNSNLTQTQVLALSDYSGATLSPELGILVSHQNPVPLKIDTTNHRKECER